MTLTNPLDRIEVGKHYRLKLLLAEIPPCANCGHHHGETEETEACDGTIVVVERVSTLLRCFKCRQEQAPTGGWYYIRRMDGAHTAVPYTFLQPLEATP